MTATTTFLNALSDAAQYAREAYGASISLLLRMPYGFPWFTPEESARISAYHDELAAKYGDKPAYNQYGSLQAGLMGSDDERWQDQKDVYDAEVAAGERQRSYWPFNFNEDD